MPHVIVRSALWPTKYLPVKVLSRMFRGKMLCLLKQAYRSGKVMCVGESAELGTKRNFQLMLDAIYKQEWVVYAREPLGR